MDKALVYDFANSTIEHIYPRNASGSTINSALEPLKNTLGNLTILGTNDNQAGGNSDFATKKPIFLNYSGKINSTVIAVKSDWTHVEVRQHKDLLKNIAMKVFKL